MKPLLSLLLLGGMAMGQDGTELLQFRPNPQPEQYIMISGSRILRIEDKAHKLMVDIASDGKVVFGEGYGPDESAAAFWVGMSKYYKFTCFEPKLGQNREEYERELQRRFAKP